MGGFIMWCRRVILTAIIAGVLGPVPLFAQTPASTGAPAAPSAAPAAPPSASPAGAANGTAAGAVDPSEYRIGPEDVIQVSVWKNDAISRTVPVRPDGKVTLPL